MEQIQFLEILDVILIHEDQINLYGGINGIRSFELLESAVNMPKASFDGYYLHSTIFDKASAYIYHITQNHPFLDGNKRTALATGLVFLDLNGIEVEEADDELYNMMISVSNGNLKKDEISELLKSLS